MKRTRTAALVLATALVVAACGDDPASQTLGGNTTEAGSSAAETSAAGSSATTEAAGSSASTTMAGGSSASSTTAAAGEGTIVDVATEAGDFTTLLAAAQAAGLVETLSGPGPLTVFAPTDEAFATALETLGLTADELLADTPTLTSILTYHVVEGEVLSTDLTDGMKAPTVNGAELTVGIAGSTVTVDDATVTTADVKASNGVIHIVDGVLLPPAAS